MAHIPLKEAFRMKKAMLVLCAFLLTLSLSSALAEHYGYAVIDARTSDRVHLRSQPSQDAASLGLYFSGTWAECLGSPLNEWVPVRIGQTTGFMMSRYLLHESASPAVASQQPAATVNSAGWLNLRERPDMDSPVLRQLQSGTSVILLGETADGWSYIRIEDCLHGYVDSSFLTVHEVPAAQELSFAALPSRWLFSSGAGAWDTELILFPDGHFEGSFHDSEMGSNDPAYPYGTVYTASFYGLFSQPVRISDTIWQTTVTEYYFDGTEGEETIRDGIRYITTAGHGLAQGDVLTIYLPGTQEEQLPADFSFWNHAYEGGTLETCSLYNLLTDTGFEPQ